MAMLSQQRKVLLATEKAFAPKAVQEIEAVLGKAGYAFDKLEGYTNHEELLAASEGCDAMIIRSDKADKALFDAAANLKLIVRAGAGVDNIDLAAATERNVVAMNTPGQNSNAVAELAFGMLVMHVRNHFDGSTGRELRGRRLGLVGCGQVSQYMTKVAKGFGMLVSGIDPFLTPKQIKAIGADPVSSMEELFSTCDFVSLHIPATKETRNSIGRDLLQRLPADGGLINTARLEVVDEDALTEILLARPDLAYITDVQLANKAKVQERLGEKQFAKQIISTPKKMGAQTAEANNNAGGAAARQIVDFFETGDISCQVNKRPGAPSPNVYKWSGGEVSLNVTPAIGADRVVNFSAGPCCLPLDVLERARDEMLNWRGSGMSVMEMSHRSKEFESIVHKAEKDMREILNVPKNFKILFLQGGATAQFAAVPLNLLGKTGAAADYIITGQWGDKALDECKKWGAPALVANGKPSKYTRIPGTEEWKLNPDAAFVHYTANETVNGVEFKEVPSVAVPLVCDHSSNFMSKPIDWAKHAVVYAGAQKNVGPAGVTIAFVRDDVLGKELKECPNAMSWKAYAKADSLYNTPACFAIYVMGLYLEHVKEQGGVAHFDKLAEQRSQMLYEAIDSSGGFYSCPVDRACRSRMNVPFVIKGDDVDLTKKFLAEAAQLGMTNLAGHRTVGGLRASLYNAMPTEGVAKLCSHMEKFKAKYDA
jgi:phosphoserine aminotransferase